MQIGYGNCWVLEIYETLSLSTEVNMDRSNEKNKPQLEHIAAIFKEYTTPSRVLRSFTNLSNTVIQTALSGQSKFVFEILQNADDAFEDQHREIEVKFILRDNYLIVHHNGKGFDFNDVERICDYASQIEEVKATDLSKTGYKGLGFKSLFNLSDCIYIYSNGYSFRFDKKYWPDYKTKPWQVIPIWCAYEELPLNKIYPYDQPVNFILRVNDVNQLESQLGELVDQPEMLLYLHRITKLSLNLKEGKHFIERIVENFGAFKKIVFYKNQLVTSTWLSRTYTCYVPREVQTRIQKASQFIYPDKIKKAKQVPLTFTLKCDGNLKKILMVRGFCYSTVPTQLHLALPYHVNSIFILNLDRTQLHENEWNEFLIYHIGNLQFSLLKDLAELTYLKNYVINLYVRKITHLYGSFNRAFSEGFIDAKGKVSWLPAHHGSHLLKLGEAWTDETEFFRQNFQNIKDEKIYPYLINYDVKNQNDLCTYTDGTKHFTYDQLFEDFPNKYYPQLTKGAYINFISYLYKRLKGTTAMWKLQNVRFLVAKTGALLCPVNALLDESENSVPHFLMLNPVDNGYLPLSNADLIKDWLCCLGARRLKTPIQIIRESIFKWIDSGNYSHLITKNHILIINYLAKGIQEFTKNDTEKLKENLHILTKSNKFRLAKFCYLSDAASFEQLTNIISDDEKVSSYYDMNCLKEFFIHIGVHKRLNPNDVMVSIAMWIKNGEINDKLTINNYKHFIEFVAKYYPVVEHELTELKKIPVLTCSQIFQKAQVCYFDSAVLNIKGLEGVIEKNELVSTKNLSKTVHKFLKKIGVSEKIAPIDVMQRSVLRWIKEGNITNKITHDNHYVILKYIGEAWATGLLSGLKPEFLKEMPVLTESGTFRAACNCYISNSASSNCEKIPGLEFIISSDEFVSSKYHNCDEIKYLLKDLGVHNLKFTDIFEKYSYHLTCHENVEWFFSELVKYWNKAYYKTKDKLLSCLQKKFQASSCLLLTKNDKTCNPKELYSSQFDTIYDIDPNSIPLLNYEKLPEDLERYLGFKTELDLKCIMQLFKAIKEKPELGENRTLIFFTTLLEQLKKKDKNEVGNYQLSLLSKDNKLRPAKDLYYFIEENATCYLDSCYLKRIQGMSHEKTLELAKLCGANTLPFEEKIKREEETYDNTLREFYLKRLPFIVVLESKERNEELSTTLKILYNAVHAIELYKCLNISVTYPFGNTTEIPQHFADLTIYVVGKWTSKRIKIHNYLREKLGIKANIDDIMDMDLDDNQEWFRFQKKEIKKEIISVQEMLKLMFSKEEGKLLTLTEKEFEQPHHSEDEENYFKDSKFLGNKELTGNDSSLVDYTEDNSCLQTPDEEELKLLTSVESVKVEQPHHSEDKIKYFKVSKLLGKKEALTSSSSEPSIVNYVEDEPYLQTPEKEELHILASIESAKVEHPHHFEDEEKHFKVGKLLGNKEAIIAAKSSLVNYFEDEPCLQRKEELYIVTPAESVKVEQPYYSEGEENLFRDRKLPGNEVRTFAKSSSLDNIKDKSCLHISVEGELYNILTPVESIKKKKPFPHHSQDEETHFKNSKILGNPEEFTGAESSSVDYVEHKPCLQMSEEELYVLTFIDNIKVKQSLHFKAKEKHFKDSKLLKNKEELSAAESTVDYEQEEPCLQMQCAVNDDGRVQGTFIAEPEVMCYKTTGSTSEDNIEVNAKWLVPSALRIYHKRQQSEISSSYCSSAKSFHNTRSSRFPKKADSKSKNIIEVDTQVLFPNKLKIDCKRIQQSEVPDSSYFSVKSFNNAGPSRFLRMSSDEKRCKWLSEKYVFTFLQNHFKNKYPNSQFNLMDGLFTLQRPSYKIEIVWLNANEEKRHPYDLLLKKEGEVKWLIEVKSTDDVSHDSFNISHCKFITKNNQLAAESTSGSIIKDIIEVDTKWLDPGELEIDHKKESEILGSSYFSVKSFHNMGSSTFLQEASDEKSYKWLSEKYVFTFLQNHYKNKYPKSQFNLLDGLFTLQWLSHKIEIVWLNENEEKMYPYDLLLKKQGEIKWLIEVESTNTVGSNISFNISHRKFIEKINQLATEFPELKEKFCIYHIFNADNSSTSSNEVLNSSAVLYKVVPLKSS